MRRIVVAGASRGIGAAVAGHFAGQGDEIIALSRGKAPHGRWIACDLRDPAQISALPKQIGGSVDALLYAGGIWEDGAFTDAYRFAASPPQETAAVLAVNLTAPILLTQALLPLLGRGSRVVLVGSLSALDNTATVEVANSASKYGLRGAAQALALSLHPMGIGVGVINPGNVATEEVVADISEGRFAEQTPIPMADLLAAFDFALRLSPASVAREINLAQVYG
ncbi:MAG: SDR family NAD(P)-dependent oxidoreductase [Tabrizicola sp.]|jgi:NAD(P)-dependent dehydrogenase (short-subunit alcohol dehydrogenase family)|nr:SDR family NAD(P)-dependent oxidoreductase [Tabrizicola sp.]